jgi:acyl-CoA thioesterase
MQRAFEQGDLLRDTQVSAHPDQPHSFVGLISEAWKMLYAFGGVTVAVGLRAIEKELDDPRLVPLHVSAIFSSGVPCGPVRIDVTPLAKSPAVFQATAGLFATASSMPNVHLHATFGAPVKGRRELGEARFPSDILGHADAIPNQASPVDIFPNAHQFETRWAHDFCTRPGRVQDEPAPLREPAEVCSWIRYHAPPMLPDGYLDPITLAAPADFLTAPLFRGLGADSTRFFPLTLAMDIQFFATTRHEWVLQHARIGRVVNGYAYGTLDLWDEDHNLLATSSQRRLCKGLPKTS